MPGVPSMPGIGEQMRIGGHQCIMPKDGQEQGEGEGGDVRSCEIHVTSLPRGGRLGFLGQRLSGRVARSVGWSPSGIGMETECLPIVSP